MSEMAGVPQVAIPGLLEVPANRSLIFLIQLGKAAFWVLLVVLLLVRVGGSGSPWWKGHWRGVASS